MSQFLDRLLNPDLGGVVKRKAVKVKDSAAATLPVAGSASITADSIAMGVGDRILYTGLSAAGDNNRIYVVENFLGGGLHVRLDADGLNASGESHPGEMVVVLDGTSEGLVMGYHSDSWAQVDFAGFVATSASSVGGSSAANVHSAELAANAATAANTVSTIMKRDTSGHSALGVLESASVSVSNLAGGGAIGLASATVDIASVALVNQTTAAQILSLPNPTSVIPIREMTVANVGSASFTMLGATVAAGAVLKALWNGSAWMAVI